MSELSTFDKTSRVSIFNHGKEMIGKSLRDIVTDAQANQIAEKAEEYGVKRKGQFGNLVEKYIFGIEPNNLPQPDFPEAGIELKSTPLKEHSKSTYAAKERLVFSMIDYMSIVNETWESSSFLRKNRLLLIMFYLYKKELNVLDYNFKFVHLLSLLEDISKEDKRQIQKDWEYIVNKVKRGEAHKISEGDTYYLGACTKGALGSDMCRQPINSSIPAKPRAFSLKQKYLNYIIQELLGHHTEKRAVLKGLEETIDEYIHAKFNEYIGFKASEIQQKLNITIERRPKHYYRYLVDKILGIDADKIEELEKADVTLRVIALEKNGKLRESISFPYFDYCKIVKQTWEESDLYELLDAKRFLFVIFRKINDNDAVLEKIKFWNFPFDDMEKAREVWERTIKLVSQNKFDLFTKISDNMNIHVRPHGQDSKDTIETPFDKHKEIKRSFWLNAKYIQEQLER